MQSTADTCHGDTGRSVGGEAVQIANYKTRDGKPVAQKIRYANKSSVFVVSC